MMINQFRGPLSTMLMFLESLLSSNPGEAASRMLSILIMHINMLLFSLNDILDYKLIETGSFVPKRQIFPLQEVLMFIVDLAK